MGYCYGRHPHTGRMVLACDKCGRAEGTTRKRRCPFGACPSAAVCATCWTPAVRKADREAHARMGCEASAARYRSDDDRRAAILASGGALRVSAIACDPSGSTAHDLPYGARDHVLVTFAVASGHRFDRIVTAQAYQDGPTPGQIATTDDYGVPSLDPAVSLLTCGTCGHAYPPGTSIVGPCQQSTAWKVAGRRNPVIRPCGGTVTEWTGARPGRPGVTLPAKEVTAPGQKAGAIEVPDL